ncbi:MAG: glycoside hydrolase domain-containing protein [bacterium]
MNHLRRTLGCMAALVLLALTPYCEDVYRWPKAQLSPPEPVAEAPFIVIPQSAAAPVIDGDLSDDCWTIAVSARPFLRVYEGFCAPFPTEAKLFYDDKNLYVGFICTKIHPEQHTAKEFAEVLLTPPSTTEFYKAAVCEDGTLDTHIWGGIPIPSWRENPKYAVKTIETGWTAEYAIPFSAMETSPPKPGDIWKANLGRRVALPFRYNVAWAITYAWFYEPDFFGSVCFGGKDALSAEFSEISIPVPNHNPVQLKITNRSSNPAKCAIEIGLTERGPDRIVFSEEVTVAGGETVQVPAFYELSDGGRQVATIRVRELGDNRCILLQSVPSHMPQIRKPYSDAVAILTRSSEPGKENLFQRADEKQELNWVRSEIERLRPPVMSRTITRKDWEDLQDPAEILLGRTEKLEWWAANGKTLSECDFAVATEDTLTKLLRNRAFLGSPTHNASITAARGEFEGLQLVLVPRNQELNNARVEIPSLRGPGRNEIPVKNIQWRWVDFVRTRQPHCPVDYIGWYPDPLMPGTPRTIPEGTVHQPIWITVQVPTGIESGDYRGILRVCADNQAPWEIELTVHVYGFDLPKKPALRTSLWLHPTTIAKWYGWDEIPKEIRRNQYAFLLEHRINPTPISEPYLALEDLEFCVDRGLNAVQLGFAAAADWPIEEYDLVDEYYKYLKEHDLLDLGYIYARDEPPPGLYASVRETLDHVAEAFPGLRRVGTISPPAPPLEGGIDAWVVGPNLFYYKPVAERVAARDEMWLYLSASVKRPFVNWYIDYTGVENRLITWHCWKYGASGLLYWGINQWLHNAEPWSGDPEIDNAIREGRRWPDVPWNTWSYLNSNGEAQLVYPGPEGEFWSSIRLEIIRDAIDDYDYFALLKKTCDQLDSNRHKMLIEQSQAFLDIGPPISYDLTKSTSNPKDLLERRNEVAEQIERNLRAIR